VGEIYDRDSLAGTPFLYTMFKEATSEKYEVSREVPEAKVQVVNEEASSSAEVSGRMKRRPLCRWVSRVVVGGCQEVEVKHPALPKGWVLRV
jgi:hypothetical protein